MGGLVISQKSNKNEKELQKSLGDEGACDGDWIEKVKLQNKITET